VDAKTKKRMKKTLSIIGDVLLVMFIIFVIVLTATALSIRSGNVAHVFGYTIRSIQSDSMALLEDGELVENGFFKGDIVICEMMDENSEYQVGDAVLFKMPIMRRSDGSYRECGPTEVSDEEIFVIHGVSRVEESYGVKRYYTQGLTNPTEDANVKYSDEIIAKYNGVRFAGLGHVVDFLQTQFGFFLCIILPCLILVLFQGYRVVSNVIAYNREKAIAEATAAAEADLTEERKRQIAEEYLRQQAALKSSASDVEAPDKSEDSVGSHTQNEDMNN
jgi:signal peptidase I